MPYRFEFRDDNEDHLFSCILQQKQCIGHLQNNPALRRCKRKSVLGSPMCFQHLESLKHLKIKPSLIPNGGKGLFAFTKTALGNAIIFKKGENIIEYQGEILSRPQLENRYGDKTAPYGAELKEGVYIDAAGYRSIGAFANAPNVARQANAKLITVYNTTPQQIKIKAIRNILNGQEILIDYGKEYRFDEEGVTHSTKYVRP